MWLKYYQDNNIVRLTKIRWFKRIIIFLFILYRSTWTPWSSGHSCNPHLQDSPPRCWAGRFSNELDEFSIFHYAEFESAFVILPYHSTWTPWSSDHSYNRHPLHIRGRCWAVGSVHKSNLMQEFQLVFSIMWFYNHYVLTLSAHLNPEEHLPLLQLPSLQHLQPLPLPHPQSSPSSPCKKSG